MHKKVNAVEPYYLSHKKVFFIYYQHSYFTGPVFGNMDNFTGLGVFVDTYPNEEKHLEVCWSSTA